MYVAIRQFYLHKRGENIYFFFNIEEFAKILTDSLKSLRDDAVKPAVSTAVSVPVFDPEKDDEGASRSLEVVC